MRAGQREFGEIVRRHQAMVFSIAHHMLRDATAAEDVAQDVFLQLHQHLAAIESEPHMISWLRRVACQRSIDQCRKRKLRTHPGLEHLPEPAAPRDGRDPMLAALLEKLVGSLPPRARAVVVLRYQEDLDPSEIAAMLEVPVATVKSQLHRSLTILRARLERKTVCKGAPR
ncbi:MAG: sigma-70 family RNA polymerase sigma factor [Bryobacteraceae bacterium]|nr:sigma-70 family RNA polymerase sigma factor [Bryobacteraceae bacterium]